MSLQVDLKKDGSLIIGSKKIRFMVSGKKVSEEKRKCYFCNSTENEPRIIGNYIVELSEIEHKGETQLTCQGCKRKRKVEEKYKNNNQFKKAIRFLGFRRN